MRSEGDLFAHVWSLQSLLQAWRLARQGKRSRVDVCHFEREWIDHLLSIGDALRNGTWCPGPYKSFVFEEHGKRRLISAAPFADRIVHHTITGVLEPVWERRFLPWSFANRTGRGTHAAMRVAAAGVERFRFSLQLDIRRYFPSIDHVILKEQVARHVREESMRHLVGLVINSGDGLLTSEWKAVLFPGDDLLALARPKGMPIGNQTSQFLANVMLHPIDLCVAHEIKPGLAARYVDDLVMFDDDLGKLRAAREMITERLASLRLVPHPRKTRLRSTNDGVTFVGYRLTKQGVRLPRSSVTRFHRRLRVLAECYADGEIELSDVRSSVAGMLGHAQPGHIHAVVGQALGKHPFVRHR